MVHVLKYVLTVAAVLALWWNSSATINTMMDVNLTFIKVGSSLLGDEWGPMTESALRMLAGEKAMVFLEVGIVFSVIFWVIGLLIAAGRKPFTKTK